MPRTVGPGASGTFGSVAVLAQGFFPSFHEGIVFGSYAEMIKTVNRFGRALVQHVALLIASSPQNARLHNQKTAPLQFVNSSYSRKKARGPLLFLGGQGLVVAVGGF